MSSANALILPVEFQVREFDAKLLLAGVAAERGIPTYIGFQGTIRNRITELPKGLFIAKSFASKRAAMLEIMVQLGHRVFAWDEEGLVRHPPEIYYDRRMSKASLQRLSGIFAWGEDYVDLIENCPFYDGTPVHRTGNPRFDLLRPELRSFYDETVSDIHHRFGRFILIDSSFGFANLAAASWTERQQGTARDLTASAHYWKAQLSYRAKLFVLFREMVGELARNFPQTRIVVRPHPAESVETWRELASGHGNIEIVAEGNVVPWLLAADLMIHNGCMTAIEGALLDKPVLSYMPLTSELYDRPLPNSVSHQCGSLQHLFEHVEQILGGALGPTTEDDLWSSLEQHLFRQRDGRLCSDRVVDVIGEAFEDEVRQPEARPATYAKTWMQVQTKALGNLWLAWFSKGVYSSEHIRHQFPEISVSDVERRLARLQTALGRFSRVKVRPVRSDLFLLGEN